MSADRKSWIIPEVSRLPVDILSQILYYKTQDVGKTYGFWYGMLITKKSTSYAESGGETGLGKY